MKKLKIVLQSNCFYCLLVFSIFIYVIIFTVLIKYDSVYSNGDTITGKVIKYEKSNDKISFILKAKEKIKVNYYINEELNIKIGSVVSVKEELTIPSSNTIPNTFNYKKYLYNNKIYRVINADSIKINKDSISFFEKIKNVINERCNSNSYLNLFIIGNKSYLDNETYNMYKDIGVAHLLAISGMHISVFILLISKLLFFLKKNTQSIVIIMFLLFYSYIISFTASILRATLFYIISYLNRFFKLKIISVKLLLVAAFIILLINPFFVYDVGFIYSFVTVFGILLCKKYLTKNYFLNIVIITFFTMLFTLPITINLNYEINIITIISNLLLIPFVSFIVYPAALVTFCFPIFNFLFNYLIIIMEYLVNIISKIDFLSFNIPKISFAEIIIYYSLLIAFVYYNSKRHLLFILFLIIEIKIRCYLTPFSEIYFFDVGQGDSSLIISPYKKDIIMIDTGGVTSYSSTPYFVSDKIILFLKSIGITKVDYLIITHGDYDHMGDGINIINNIKVSNVIFNNNDYNNLELNLIKELKERNINYYNKVKQLTYGNSTLRFLNQKYYDNENDASIVLYTKINNFDIILMGDAGIKVENDLIKKYNLSNIEILKVGHHGSDTSSSEIFIEKTKPKYSVISVGKNNRYGHPKDSVLNNLENSKIYRTDVNGSINYKFYNNRLYVKSCDP